VGAPGAGIIDLSLLRVQARMVQVHVWLTYAVCAVLAGFIASTWDQPRRSALVALAGGYFLVATVAALTARSRAAHGRYREAWLLLWSAAEVGLIAGFVVVDRAVASPLALLFFVPLLIAALSYPVLLVVAIGTMEMIAYVGISADTGTFDSPYVPLFAFSIGVAALACSWQAHIHEEQRTELVERSRTDPLTGCLNRRGFYERLEAELDAGRRLAREVTVLMLDLDAFKAVNDSQGHVAGDELLCWTVQALEGEVRPMDAVGRLGGDEFAVLLPTCGAHQAAGAAARLRAVLAARVTASIGSASFPSEGGDSDALMRCADARLYGEKMDRPGAWRGEHEVSWATAFGRAVDGRMASPDKHSQGVADVAEGIAADLGLAPERRERLRLAGLLHDVGFVLLSEDLLMRPGPLTPEERVRVNQARIDGATLLTEIEGLADVADWIRHSHEHFDGSGGPDGLAAEGIPLESRVLLVADSYQAMTSARPYRPALTPQAALARLRAAGEGQFDPVCVEALVAHFDARRNPGVGLGAERSVA